MLQQLALDGLLNRYIVLGLANSHVNRHAMDKCQAVSLLINWSTNFFSANYLVSLGVSVGSSKQHRDCHLVKSNPSTPCCEAINFGLLLACSAHQQTVVLYTCSEP